VNQLNYRHHALESLFGRLSRAGNLPRQ
jgi:hypothetical protein